MPGPSQPLDAAPRGTAATLVDLLPFQQQAFWGADDIGFVLWLWRRQAGKTTTMANLALRRMMESTWRLVTYASASIAVGGEMLIREAQVWREALDKWRRLVQDRGQQLTTNADDCDFDAFCDLFEHSKVEARLHHSRSAFSRTRLIAPNPATARGYSGFVMMDEIGFIQQFKALWEAMEPIASRQPDFRVVMATTPPDDDAHYSYELAVPPEDADFSTPDPNGHWYDSAANVRVHRVDVYDAACAGVKMYDLKTRQPITPAESRKSALDRDAWDRNYALLFKSGGSAALSLLAVHTAMVRGKDQGIAAEDDFPLDWRDRLGTGPIAIGLDPATTEKQKSNPSGLAISEQVGTEYIVRLALRFKSGQREKTKAMVREALDLGKGRRPRRLVIDATNERFFAQELRSEFAGICPVELLVSSEKTNYRGEDMTFKAYLGNLLVNLFEDNLISVPQSRWLKDDLRLVVRDRGSFTTQVDSAGNHGDLFDGIKNSIHGLIAMGGPAHAQAAGVGTYAVPERIKLRRAMSERPDHSNDIARPLGISMV